MQKTLYVSDLDGTLLRGDERISDNSLDIIAGLTGRGVAFTYATARSIVSAAQVVRGFSPKIPVVVKNGVFIHDTALGKHIHTNFFSADMVQEAHNSFIGMDIYPLVYVYDEAGEHICWIEGRETPGIRRDINRHSGDPRLCKVASPDELFSGNVYYITCIGTEEEVLPVFRAFHSNQAFKCYYGKDLYSDEFWCELTPVHATKASAVLWLKEKYGFERVVCFGDAENDIPMFEIADECYAVENAVEVLKSIATGVIPSNEEDGVARWLLKNARP